MPQVSAVSSPRESTPNETGLPFSSEVLSNALEPLSPVGEFLGD